MKKLVIILITIALVLVGCSRSTQSRVPMSNSLTSNAEAILSELPENERISDFKEIHKILTNLPTNKNDFLSQLDAARAIADKWNVQLEGADWYFDDLSPVDSETMEDYITRRVDHDMETALYALVAPMLFEQYGGNLYHIPNVSKDAVLAVVESLEYYFESGDIKDEATTEVREEWKDPYANRGDCEIGYYENGLVSFVKIPIAKTVFWENEEEAKSFYNASPLERENHCKTVNDTLLEDFDGFGEERAVLSLIYTEEDLRILENYLKSLTSDWIWDNNLLITDTEEDSYFESSSIGLIYKETVIYAEFGLGKIDFTIKGRNLVNEFSSKWYVLQGGYAGTIEHKEYIEEEYADYINNNTAANREIPERYVNLDELAENF